jgi:CRP-like cAMP-binding protein
MHITDFESGQILYEPGETVHTVYFPQRAMISLVQIMEDGSTIEAGVVDRGGLVGYPAYLGGDSGASRAVVQIPGSAIALDAEVLQAEFNRSEALRSLLLRYCQVLLTQVSQNAACNRFHPTEARLARWLLQSQDARQTPDLKLTQDFLSSMLGTRRASVTAAASKLQQAEIIRYRRGHIQILDRGALEVAACECYRVTRTEYIRLLGEQTEIL